MALLQLSQINLNNMERLLNILTGCDNTKHIWILNRYYCPDQKMIAGRAVVVYSYDPVGRESPFSLETIKDISAYNYSTFVKGYCAERSEIMGYDADEKRIIAVWSFYKNVKKGDIMLFVHGSEVEGYYVIAGESCEIQNEEDFCIHSWKADAIQFDDPLYISSIFGSPFFKLINGEFKEEVINALKKRLK